jgi:sugar phosphate isomerase/epimerase
VNNLFAFSTNAYTRCRLPEALRRIRKTGFRGVEILADKPHAYATDLSPRKISTLAGQLERLDLSVSTINANTACGFFKDAPPEPFFEPSFISPKPEWRRFRIDYTRRALELAAAVGARAVTVTSGRLLGAIAPGRAHDLLLLALEAVLLHAERCGGVNIAIEYEPGLYIERADELAALIDEVGHPLLGANLDLGHAHLAGDGISGAIKLLGPKIWNVHLEDLPGDKHYHLPPGEGDLPFAEAKRALKRINYTNPITWEIYTAVDDPDEAARKTIRFLRGKWPSLR